MESLIRHFRRSANRVYCVPLGKADEVISALPIGPLINLSRFLVFSHKLLSINMFLFSDLNDNMKHEMGTILI